MLLTHNPWLLVTSPGNIYRQINKSVYQLCAAGSFHRNEARVHGSPRSLLRAFDRDRAAGRHSAEHVFIYTSRVGCRTLHASTVWPSKGVLCLSTRPIRNNTLGVFSTPLNLGIQLRALHFARNTIAAEIPLLVGRLHTVAVCSIRDCPEKLGPVLSTLLGNWLETSRPFFKRPVIQGFASALTCSLVNHPSITGFRLKLPS